jgi:hypothetical protein
LSPFFSPRGNHAPVSYVQQNVAPEISGQVAVIAVTRHYKTTTRDGLGRDCLHRRRVEHAAVYLVFAAATIAVLFVLGLI